MEYEFFLLESDKDKIIAEQVKSKLTKLLSNMIIKQSLEDELAEYKKPKKVLICLSSSKNPNVLATNWGILLDGSQIEINVKNVEQVKKRRIELYKNKGIYLDEYVIQALYDKELLRIFIHEILHFHYPYETEHEIVKQISESLATKILVRYYNTHANGQLILNSWYKLLQDIIATEES